MRKAIATYAARRQREGLRWIALGVPEDRMDKLRSIGSLPCSKRLLARHPPLRAVVQ
ncbi:MAG: hypothetical protein ACTHOJ_17115 [Sphingomonas oligoaromativorans]